MTNFDDSGGTFHLTPLGSSSSQEAMQWAAAVHPGEFVYVAGGSKGKGIGESLLEPDFSGPCTSTC